MMLPLTSGITHSGGGDERDPPGGESQVLVTPDAAVSCSAVHYRRRRRVTQCRDPSTRQAITARPTPGDVQCVVGAGA